MPSTNVPGHGLEYLYVLELLQTEVLATFQWNTSLLNLGRILELFEHLSIADPKTAEMVSTQKILEQRCSTLPISR